MDIANDIRFAEAENDELPSIAAKLRYVAAINLKATRTEFVAACVACGYRANASANRFRESRHFDVREYGHTFNKDGSIASYGD